MAGCEIVGFVCRARLVAVFAAIGAIINPGVVAWGQAAPGIHQDNSGMNGSISHEELERMGGDQTQASKSAKEAAAAKSTAMAQSAPLIKALQISCDIDDANLVISGTRQPVSGGKKVDTRVYEVACNRAVGYLLEVQGTDTPIAISCIAAEEARAADVAKGKEPGFFCKLPENQDVYALVSSLIRTGAGADCVVDVLQSLGRSESTQSSYSEIKCKDDRGYLLRLPLPGSTAKAAAMSCADAAKQGVRCRLTETAPDAAANSGDELVTVAVLKSALAQNGVSCNVAKLRLIGQEDHLKRYVVEYLCEDQPTGAVAFIPLTGNTHPYESMDCDKALLNRIPCSLVPGK
jgi:hypothetical protein